MVHAHHPFWSIAWNYLFVLPFVISFDMGRVIIGEERLRMIEGEIEYSLVGDDFFYLLMWFNFTTELCASFHMHFGIVLVCAHFICISYCIFPLSFCYKRGGEHCGDCICIEDYKIWLDYIFNLNVCDDFTCGFIRQIQDIAFQKRSLKSSWWFDWLVLGYYKVWFCLLVIY